MSQPARLFLMVVAPVLALVLSCLGVETGARNLLGWVLALVGVAFVAGGLIYYWTHRGEIPAVSEEKDDRSFWLILPGFLAVFFGPPLELLYLPEAEVLPRTPAAQAAGLALVGAASALLTWTRLALRDLYTGHVQVTAGHRLVREGPYRHLRHPGYAGFVLLALGLGVGYGSVIGLLSIPLLLLPALAYRMSVEERLLAGRFGQAYRDYAEGTKRLIPGVW